MLPDTEPKDTLSLRFMRWFADKPWADDAFWIFFTVLAVTFIALLVGMGLVGGGLWGLLMVFLAVGEFIFFFGLIVWKVWRDRQEELVETED